MTPVASVLGVLYVVSELGLTIRKRANANSSRIVDRGSLSLLWIVIFVSVLLAFYLPIWVPEARMRAAPALRAAGILLFAAGLTIRWYAIRHLGRFFTVNVAIAADHRLNDSGPYRVVRHPAYTGSLMAFLGLFLCLTNWASLAAMVPIVLVFMRRIRIEEAALLQAFGDEYRSYMDRTQRLIPAVY